MEPDPGDGEPDSGDGEPDPGDDAAVVMEAPSDPAPERSEPGEYVCDGCPDADFDAFRVTVTDSSSTMLSGAVGGAAGDGAFYLAGAGGQAVAGTIPTQNGAYALNLPLFCGTQLFKGLWTNDAGTYVAVVEITAENCVDADLRVTLTWDDLGDDFELHLIKEGGQINDNATDCTWTSCIGQGPDWGVEGDDADNPVKDVDNTGSYGPENIFYNSPEDGLYTVMVEHWGGGQAQADGVVTINLLGEQPVTIPITDLPYQSVFTAATIAWPSKLITAVESTFDCSANWASGCKEDLP